MTTRDDQDLPADPPAESADSVQPDPPSLPPPSGEGAEAQMRRMSRRSFLWGAAALGSVYAGWRFLISQRADDGALWPFRRVLEANEELARDYYRPRRLAATFDRSRAEAAPRINGDLGLDGDIDAESWRLRVVGLAHPSASSQADSDSAPVTREFSLAQIRALPFAEMTTELHCIEGWTQIVHWGGARLRDFLELNPPATKSGDPPDLKRRPDDLPEYVSLATPDGGYYVGIDIASALHPQTLLCYEMNGAPLTPEHGAPLRLVIPVKYGVKNIKRIGAIKFANSRPADYWAEQGYDWYIGL